MTMTKSSWRHAYKRISHKGRSVCIDKDIVSLLEKMWKLGIETTSSCQANCNFACKHKYKVRKLENGIKCKNVVPTKDCYNNVWLAFFR